jgi:NADH:ubiquinone oxidoreductase subunit 6 (subunit J)
MKHLFYVLYVLIYTGAVFVCGMFVGQFFERSWARKEQDAKAKALSENAEPIGVQMPETHVAMTGKRK